MRTEPTATTAPRDGLEPFDRLLERYGRVLRRMFSEPGGDPRQYLSRGLPPSELRALLAARPLSVFVPRAYGGRGALVHEGLAMLERTSYHSLPVGLTMGINGALFLQPVAKYAAEEIRRPIFERFLDHQNMGGLMMTEPGYGSDALSMETAWTRDGDLCHIQGTKHWAGLTGLADYWLMTARAKSDDGRLARDVDFFVLDAHVPEQAVVVEERFENLGLYPIPYGRNRIDVRVPERQRLVPQGSGLKMMLDLLHRSRVQFPGMGLGFLRRLADEGLAHARERMVGGRPLLDYDQVQRRLVTLQASVTIASAMCLFASERAGIEHDLSREGLTANAVKATLTDRMQQGAQSLLQLVGAKGYRLDHIAGRSVIDSRPFQIFEGSNDILYEQIAGAVLQSMRRAKETHLGTFLGAADWAHRAADRFQALLDLRIEADLPQRRMVDLGKALGEVASTEMVIELGERGFARARIRAAIEQLETDVALALGAFRRTATTQVQDDQLQGGAWLAQLRLAGS